MPNHQNVPSVPPSGTGIYLRSDSQVIARGREYVLALRFSRKRRGLGAFDWVAVWRTPRGRDSRAFPPEAHGFAEALQGAATTILIETGMAVPKDELEIASYKERRVTEYLRREALQEVTEAETASARPNPSARWPGPASAWLASARGGLARRGADRGSSLIFP